MDKGGFFLLAAFGSTFREIGWVNIAIKIWNRFDMGLSFPGYPISLIQKHSLLNQIFFINLIPKFSESKCHAKIPRRNNR